MYGDHSDWKVFYDADGPPEDGEDQSVREVPWRRLNASHKEKSRAMRQALILHGIDFNGARALVSTAHTDDIIEETLTGFEAAVQALKEENVA